MVPVTWCRLERRGRACLAGIALFTLALPAMCDSVQPVDASPQANEEPIAFGRLRPFGHYLNRPSGSTATVLPNGSVLIYGAGPWTHSEDSQAAQTMALHGRQQRGYPSSIDPAPKLWDRARRGWSKLPPAPECPEPARYMHTATALPDGKVLMAGGLCDQPKFRDDLTRYKAYTALSLWDAATRQWQAAPLLSEARIFHSANLMPDGSVLIVGGAVDPGLTDTPDALVLSSVEQFSAGRVTPLPGLTKARAKHTATVLGDGSLLVVGGFDDAGHALASAELWSVATRSWQPLPPARVARYSHSATWLPDGRVMVSGGIGADGQILSSVEVWDPKGQTWSDAATLPIPLYGHSAVLLSTGQVLTAGGTWISHRGPIPWAWIWNPANNAWQVAGHTTPNRPSGLAGSSTQITLVARPDGGALVFTPEHIMRWEPTTPDPQRTAPLWREQPSAARLTDDRIMLVGAPESPFGSAPTMARIWDPVARLWADAGTLGKRTWMHDSTLQLPSGRVIHVGVDGDSTMICEAWEKAANRWQPCGSIHVQKEVRGRVRLGLLPGGRAFAIANDEDVLVLDEAHSTWAAWQPQWHTKSMAYGAPIRSQQPLLTIQDAASGQSVGINDEAARFWQDGGSAATRLSLLWESQSQRWAYIFLGRKMGADAQWLPDGCALSTNPLAVFNPISAKVTPLVDPGLGIEPGQAEMVVLTDGTVVAAGVADGAKDPGGGFFQGKASCAGFEPHADDDDYIAGGLAADTPATAPDAAKAASSPSQAIHWRERVMSAMPSRSVLIIVILGALVGYALIKASGSRRMLIGGLALIIGLTALWLQGRLPGSRNATPCKMVGVWSSRQGGQMRRIELKDDGTYAMEDSLLGIDRPGGFTGRWAVRGTKMVWQHDQGGGGLDVNAILPESDTRFTLIEGNGSRTVYELIRAVTSQHCKP